MVLLTSVRRSPGYLYLKTYLLCALVSLFQVSPVSSQVPRIRHQLEGIEQRGSEVLGGHGASGSCRRQRRELSRTAPGRKGDPSGATLLARWQARAADLADVKSLLRRDEKDPKIYPELNLDATVRRSSSLHPDEVRFIRLRQHKISSAGDDALRRFLALPRDAEVDARDVPLIALGGSGGGHRAMYGFSAFMSASKDLGLWDCATWTGGVSGSCWALAAYYTIACHDFPRLHKHYLTVAKELTHPLSLHSLDIVARSSKGVYFLIGPLVRKAQNSIIGLGIMDIYATLTTSYQLLSREPGARLSRATFQYSKVWTRSGIDQAAEPMPILTAVRRAPKVSAGVKSHADSSISKGKPPRQAMKPHETAISKMVASHVDSARSAGHVEKTMIDMPYAKGFFQWFEISPLEIGSSEVQGYIPTWSWGRTFASGRSTGRRPEQSLALLLGQCTSAPAGPLTGYITALLATLPKGTAMSRLLLLLNNFIRGWLWEGFWGNPIRAGDDPNPFFGLDTLPAPSNPASAPKPMAGAEPRFPESRLSATITGRYPSKSSQDEKEPSSSLPWESQARIRLKDSGMSNNLPSHVLARPERQADIIIAFDASSDVHTNLAIQRIQNFADDCHVEELRDVTEEFRAPETRYQDSKVPGASETESTYLHRYARVFRGLRENGQELHMVYCPLLPNGINPGFNPSTASFSNSYNLAWTPEQIKMMFATSEANLTQYAVDTIKQVTSAVYKKKKRQRLSFEESVDGAKVNI